MIVHRLVEVGRFQFITLDNISAFAVLVPILHS